MVFIRIRVSVYFSSFWFFFFSFLELIISSSLSSSSMLFSSLSSNLSELLQGIFSFHLFYFPVPEFVCFFFAIICLYQHCMVRCVVILSCLALDMFSLNLHQHLEFSALLFLCILNIDSLNMYVINKYFHSMRNLSFCPFSESSSEKIFSLFVRSNLLLPFLCSFLTSFLPQLNFFCAFDQK